MYIIFFIYARIFITRRWTCCFRKKKYYSFRRIYVVYIVNFFLLIRIYLLTMFFLFQNYIFVASPNTATDRQLMAQGTFKIQSGPVAAAGDSSLIQNHSDLNCEFCTRIFFFFLSYILSNRLTPILSAIFTKRK